MCSSKRFLLGHNHTKTECLKDTQNFPLRTVALKGNNEFKMNIITVQSILHTCYHDFLLDITVICSCWRKMMNLEALKISLLKKS